MKVLIVLSLIFVTSQADVSELVNGRYYPDNSGQYVPDASGQYIIDDSGRYIHVPNPYIHDDRPYVHTPDVFGPGGPGGPFGPGGPIGAETNTNVVRTYLPAFGGPVPAATTNVPGIVPPFSRNVPTYKGEGPYKWKLNLGDHAVENPNYSFQVDLPH